MKRIFETLLVLLALALALAGCTGEGEDETNADDTPDTGATVTTVKDAYGFDREEGCWLTECLLLPQTVEEKDLFGDAGESGLVSSWALAKDGQVNLNVTCYLTYLIYGTPAEGTVPDAYLRLSQVSGTNVLYDTECVSVGEISCIGNIEAALDMSKPPAERLEIRCEEKTLQGAIVIPITLNQAGPLYVDMWVRADGVSGSTRVDDFDEVRIGLGAADVSAEVSVFSVGYLSQSAYADGNYEESAIQDAPTFENGECSYMVLDLAFVPGADNDGKHQLKALIYVPGRGKLDVKIEDAPTSTTQKTVTPGGMTLSASFAIPQTAGQEKTVRVLVRLLPISGGEIELGLFLTGDLQTGLSGYTHRALALSTGEPTLQYVLSEDGTYYTAAAVLNPDIKSIIIPDELSDGIPVTRVAGDLFQDTNALEYVDIGNNVVMALDEYTFNWCNRLKTVRIGNGVTALDEKTFYQKEALESVSIGSGVPEIGGNAFRGCTALRELKLTDSITSIGEYAFCGCLSLTELWIPSGVSSIGKYAFKDCTALQRVRYDAERCGTMIGKNAFENSGNRALLTIGAGVKEVPNYMFEDFIGMETLVFEEGSACEKIGNYAFFHCETLRSARITCTQEIALYAFAFCEALCDLTFTTGPKKIGSDCFYYCTGLKSIVIPEGTQELVSGAFLSCIALESVTLPSTLTKIGDSAFSACHKLASITLPASVTNIGDFAFGNCLVLESLIFEGSTAQWADVTRGEKWTENTLLTAVSCANGRGSL